MKFIKNFFERRKNKKVTNKAIKLMDSIIFSIDSEIENLEEAINLMNEKYKVDALPLVANNFLFFRVTFKDIVILTKQSLEETDAKKRNLLTRFLALHLYEFLDDTKDFLGKKLKEDLEKFPDHEFHIRELYRLKDYYYSIKNNIFKELGDIRHNVAAHKNQNSIELSKSIREVDRSNVETSCMLVWMLFSLILRFQKNLTYSISNDCIKKPNTKELNKSSPEQNNTVKEYITIDSEFRKSAMIMYGVSPALAEVYSKLTPEGFKKLKELVEYMEAQKNKNNK